MNDVSPREDTPVWRPSARNASKNVGQRIHDVGVAITQRAVLHLPVLTVHDRQLAKAGRKRALTRYSQKPHETSNEHVWVSEQVAKDGKMACRNTRNFTASQGLEESSDLKVASLQLAQQKISSMLNFSISFTAMIAPTEGRLLLHTMPITIHILRAFPALFHSRWFT